MTINTLSLAELRGLSPDERERRVAAFMAARQGVTNEEANSFLNQLIRGFEIRYEVPSAVMVERIRRHEMPKTADICKWLMLLDAKESFLT